MKSELHKALVSYITAVWQFRPRLAALAAGLMLVRSLSEGAGLVLILPLLALAGMARGGDGSPSGLAQSAAGLPEFVVSTFANLNLTGVLGLFLAVMLTRAAIGFAQQMTSARLQAEFLHDLRINAHRAVLQANWPHLALQDASRINHALSLQAEQSGYGVVVLVRALSAVTLTAVSLLVAVLIEPQLTLVIVGLGILVAVPVLVFDLKLLRMSNRHAGQLEDLFAAFARELDDLKAAKVSVGTGSRVRNFEHLAGGYRDTAMARNRISAFAGLFHEVAGACLLAGLVYLATSFQGALTAGPVAVAVIFVRLFPAMKALQGSFREMLHILPAWQRLSAITQAMQTHRDEAATGQGKAPQFTSSVELENVAFAYPGGSGPVLSDVNLTISKGGATVIAGLSGAGKTTLLDLVSGLLSPQAGRVLIDGVELNADNRASWCAQVAYVVQDAQLSNGSVRDNVSRFGAIELSDAGIWKALQQAGAEGFVKKLASGLDEQLGDRGQRLSRGQRQRIALARALAMQPKLLLLDEATSALNPRDEEQVIENLRQLLPECTLLIVAHKLDQLGWCDRRVDLGDGRLMCIGC